jgi:1-acyl-sn-glycerol-3-phosphate acyltransferase
MMKTCATIILRRNGWRIINEVVLPLKCVVCIAPHTSNWDFLWGILYKVATDLQAHFLIKREWFFFPLNLLMKRLGGIPVNREKKGALTDRVAALFAGRDVLRIGITPEGTRSYNANWKLGFYYIAQKAQVPIALASIDYAQKEIGVEQLLMPSGNVEADMMRIKTYYSRKQGKIPSKFGV